MCVCSEIEKKLTGGKKQRRKRSEKNCLMKRKHFYSLFFSRLCVCVCVCRAKIDIRHNGRNNDGREREREVR
jgi:hypothetical protein